MRLLIKRDRNYLVKSAGKAEVDSDLPAKLRDVRVVPQEFVQGAELRTQNDDLVIAGANDYSEIQSHFDADTPINYFDQDGPTLPNDALPGIWSGYRSVLVRGGNDNLYRLKGVSLDLKNPRIDDVSEDESIVFGGQPRFAARFEKQMSDRYNQLLEKEGITPIMRCKGYWHYPGKIQGYRYSGSVIQVEGDTRLDELMFIIEKFFACRLNIDPKQQGGMIDVNQEGDRLGKRIAQLYSDIGFITGRLKRLMDKDNQTWSAGEGRSNAHIGNIVLYNGSEDLKVGFVDFDASCDTNDFSESEIKAMQELEYQTLMNSALAGPISPRQLQAPFFNGGTMGFFKQFRDEFNLGFSFGYDLPFGNSSRITNTIPFQRVLEIFDVLRSRVRLTPQPVLRPSGPLERRIERFDPYNILGRNKKYQENLIENSLIKHLDKDKKENNLEKYISDKDKYDDDLYGLGSYGSRKDRYSYVN